MAWRYECGVCRVTTGWLPKDQASAKRDEHRDTVHPGMVPGLEVFESNAKSIAKDPAALRMWAAIAIVCLIAWVIQINR
ncbi:hypothetical protein [Streptomyces lavendulae]|uniref:hypothetical protein n=1 Tax=Streptomyces lavendulae TaxID=1914 RepID=UPI0024A08C8F|nr:hypothetical protein [Streptomyces lavendulae]GLX22644.1 hypothetical protein Slala01_62880 [Streptomyces lavendulae subsp. lavendulae]GLX30127.1 hypothetical protein Slala02_59470 [Streptomyces lavendulae subsp. lavendulae]